MTNILKLQSNPLPAILVECGYINNENDFKQLTNNDNIVLMAKKILEGVVLYANQKK